MEDAAQGLAEIAFVLHGATLFVVGHIALFFRSRLWGRLYAPRVSRDKVGAEAIQQINDSDVVFVRKSEDRFEVRPVHLGDMFNGRVVLLEGVKPR